mgnify:CR=1 FL=1
MRRTPSPIVEIATRSAASIRSSLRLIRPPARESLVFFAEEAARAEARAARYLLRPRGKRLRPDSPAAEGAAGPEEGSDREMSDVSLPGV